MGINPEIYAIPVEGGTAVNLTQNLAWDTNPAWAPLPTRPVAPLGRALGLWGAWKRREGGLSR